jgi:hypothetical protein
MAREHLFGEKPSRGNSVVEISMELATEMPVSLGFSEEWSVLASSESSCRLSERKRVVQCLHCTTELCGGQADDLDERQSIARE